MGGISCRCGCVWVLVIECVVDRVCVHEYSVPVLPKHVGSGGGVPSYDHTCIGYCINYNAHHHTKKQKKTHTQTTQSLDAEGRVVMTDHGTFILVNVYGPAICSEDRVEERFPFKLLFYQVSVGCVCVCVLGCACVGVCVCVCLVSCGYMMCILLLEQVCHVHVCDVRVCDVCV